MNAVFRLKSYLLVALGLLLFLGLAGELFSNPPPTRADGFINFEDGVDGQPIRSTIPGLHFTTTQGYDWVYGDVRSGKYNAPYPDCPYGRPDGGTCSYTLNGNFFAWLGPNQGDGRIDFLEGGASYLYLWVSAGEPVELTAYFSNGEVAGSSRLEAANLNTGRLSLLGVFHPLGLRFDYVIISGQANYWLIDDLSTDAKGVPNANPPLIFVPGVMGSELENDADGDGVYTKVWADGGKLVFDPVDSHLDVLQLAPNGQAPLHRDNPAYSSVRVGEIVQAEPVGPFREENYSATLAGLRGSDYQLGENLFTCPYDWRKSLVGEVRGLDRCVKKALSKTGAKQVNILAHSMGGLLAKQYLLLPEQAAKVQRLVTLGTPYLGTPKVAAGIFTETCYLGVWKWQQPCLLYPPKAHQLLQNFPGAYQLAPSRAYFEVWPDGYLHRAWDANGDGRVDGPLDEVASLAALASHNHRLAQEADTWHTLLDGWRGRTNGVQVVMIVGDGHGTIGRLVEAPTARWEAPFQGETKIRVETMSNGDGSVPVWSADMRNLAEGVNLAGPEVSVFYTELEHQELAQSHLILQFAADIFDTPLDVDPAQALLRPAAAPEATTLRREPGGLMSEVPARPAQPQTTPTLRTEPRPLTGRFISVEGPVTLELVDAEGRRLGASDPADAVENRIPGATYQPLADSTALFVPAEATYVLRAFGQATGSVDVRIQKIEQDAVTQTAVYDDLPLTGRSTATLAYDPQAANPGAFALDQDGDGVSETTFPPTALLDGRASQDVEAPLTTIELTGPRGTDGGFIGPVTVTLTATDAPGGSGLAKVTYSLDAGQTVNLYSGPFIIDPHAVSLILAQATDRAGNEEAPFAQAEVQPGTMNDLYLPFIIK